MIQYYYVLALKARTDYMFCAGFFHTRKNLKNFSKEVIKSHLAVLIWCGKRDKHFSNHKGKEECKRITGGKRNPGKRNQKQREKALQCRCKNWGKGIY